MHFVNQPVPDGYRMLRHLDAVVPYEPRRSESASMRAFLASAASSKASKKHPSAGSAQDAGSVTSGGADAGGGGGGGDGDGDDGGDGDGDGPRRSRPRTSTPRTFRATRRSRQQLPPKPDPEHAHRRALNTFLGVTALLLGTALAFGLNGQVGLADKVLGTFVSVATVAAALLRPK